MQIAKRTEKLPATRAPALPAQRASAAPPPAAQVQAQATSTYECDCVDRWESEGGPIAEDTPQDPRQR